MLDAESRNGWDEWRDEGLLKTAFEVQFGIKNGRKDDQDSCAT